MPNGFPLTAFEIELNGNEAQQRDEHNSAVDAARGAIAECLRLVKIQAKGASGDWSEVIARLEELPDELPAVRS
jgi:hypothetical protein